jgi:hypothetical protein
VHCLTWATLASEWPHRSLVIMWSTSLTCSKMTPLLLCLFMERGCDMAPRCMFKETLLMKVVLFVTEDFTGGNPCSHGP